MAVIDVNLNEFKKDKKGVDVDLTDILNQVSPSNSSLLNDKIESPIRSKNDEASLGLMAGAIGTEIAISEAGRFAGAAAAGPLGFVIGGLTSGAYGSLVAQRMIDPDNISYGRVLADAFINLIPGSKAAKGTQAVADAVARQGAVGAGIAAGGEHTLHLAAIDWENLRKGQPLTYDQVERIYSYMSVDKNKLKSMIKDSMYDIAMLKEYYGLKTDDVWFEAFDAAPKRDVQYLRKMRKNGEKLNEAPRITLSTIHGAKGGECENVVLLTDLSLNTMKSYEQNPDDENRLFYVGATRTKEHLHVVEPKQKYKGYNL